MVSAGSQDPRHLDHSERDFSVVALSKGGHLRGVGEIVLAKMVTRRLMLPGELSAFRLFGTSAQTRPQIAKHAYAFDQGRDPQINNCVMYGFLCAGDAANLCNSSKRCT